MRTLAQASIGAGSGLVTAANPASGQKSQFALFTDDWIQLQGYVGAALELPINKGDFETKYGTFGSSTKIADCIAAMKAVKDTATEFGNPMTLRAAIIANPDVLASKTPPTEIYTHTVWLGQRVHATAGRIVSGYESVLEELPGLPRKEQVESLKEYLFDQTLGPIPLSKKMSEEVGVLIKKLGVFEKKMNEYNAKLQAYTGSTTAMIADVNTAIGGLEKKIKDLEGSRDAAYQAWKDFTIAAVSTTVGCVIIGAVLAPFTAGVSALVGSLVGIAAGAGLMLKAEQCYREYNAYCTQISTQTEELRKKVRLRSDLGDFDKQVKLIAPAMASFLKSLQTVQSAWVDMNNTMLGINNDINEGNVGESAFLVKSKAKLAIDSWKDVDNSARQFTKESLIDCTTLAFGQPMPASMPRAA